MDTWDDLLLTGGFAPREPLLQHLTAEQAGTVPAGAPHSIYQELWHAKTVLRILLDQGQDGLGRWPYAEHFPASSMSASQDEWDALVAAFLSDSRRAVSLAQDTEWLNAPEPGSLGTTWRDALAFGAVHTAYHLGRVVLLRQLMHLWPPKA